MKKFVYYLSIAMLLLFAPSAWAQGVIELEAISGPPGGASMVGTAGDYHVAVTASGLYKRLAESDGAWEEIVLPDSIVYTSNVRIFDNNIYLITYYKIVYKSSDSGQTWTLLNPDYESINTYLTIGDQERVEVIKEEKCIYLDYSSVYDTTIIVSKNAQNEIQEQHFSGAITWQELLEDNTLLLSIRDEESNITTYWISTDSGVFKKIYESSYQVNNSIRLSNGAIILGNQITYDEGDSWSVAWLDSTFNPILQYSPITDRLFNVSPHDGLVFSYSDDLGLSWEGINTNRFYYSSKIMYPQSNGDLYIVSRDVYYRYDGLLKSNDNGITWLRSNENLPCSNYPNQFEVYNDTLYFLNNVGLWRKQKNDITWACMTDSCNIADSVSYSRNSFILTPDKIIINVNGKVILTNHSFSGFQDVTPEQVKSISISLIGDTLFCNYANESEYKLSFSNNYGSNWDSIDDILAYGKGFKIVELENGMLLGFDDAFLLYKSSDGGFSWEVIGSFYFKYSTLIKNSIYVTNINSLVMYDGQNNQFHLKDLPCYPLDGIDANTVGHIYMPSHYILDDFQLFRSFDNGTTWSGINTNVNGFLTRPYFDDNDYLYLFNSDSIIYRSKHPLNTYGTIKGHIKKDTNDDCVVDDLDTPLPNIIMKAEGDFEFYGVTDSTGFYQIVTDTGQYIVKPNLWNSFFESCQVPQNVLLQDSAQVVDSINFAINSLINCPWFEVSLTPSFLRPCMDSYYNLYYCNHGTAEMENAMARVILDPACTVTNLQLPYTQSGDTLYIQLGTVEIGECKSTNISVFIDCETELGATLCSEAAIFPDTACVMANGSWSGASVQVEALCDGDSLIQFNIKNIGTAPTQTLNYIIIEDQIVLLQGQFNLEPNETLPLSQMASGAIWRIEAEQEPFHPGFSQPTAVLEGCGGINTFGLVNQLPLDDMDPFVDEDCSVVTGSFDPNDKNGFPSGVGEERFINKNTDIEYLIRFQNTGTDTAFTVILVDTLSPLLDAATLRVGAASHPYEWSLEGQGVLKVFFKHILLPDSNVNEAASHGFFRYRISQQPDLNNGSKIHNEAAIYFDYNDPVITNQTLHTVGTNFLVIQTKTPYNNVLQCKVSPNPFVAETVIELQGEPLADAQIFVYDILGNIVHNQPFTYNKCTLQAAHLSAGTYMVQIKSGEKIVAAGKLLKQ